MARVIGRLLLDSFVTLDRDAGESSRLRHLQTTASHGLVHCLCANLVTFEYILMVQTLIGDTKGYVVSLFCSNYSLFNTFPLLIVMHMSLLH